MAFDPSKPYEDVASPVATLDRSRPFEDVDEGTRNFDPGALLLDLERAHLHATPEGKSAINSMMAVAPDDEAKARATNQLYVNDHLPLMPLNTLTKNWPAIRDGYAKSIGYTQGSISENSFTALLQQKEEAKKKDQWAISDAMGKIGAMYGGNDEWGTSFQHFSNVIGTESGGTKGDLFTIPKAEGTGTFAGLIDATNRFSAGLLTPENVAAAAVTGGAGAVAEIVGTAKAAVVARVTQAAVLGTFTAVGAKSTVDAVADARMVLADPDSTSAKKSDAIATVVLSALMTAAAAKGTYDFAGAPKTETGEAAPPDIGKQIEAATLLRAEAKKQPPAISEVLKQAAEQVEPAKPEKAEAPERAEYDSLTAQLHDMVDKAGTPEYNAIQQQIEDIKNRNEGMPPGEMAGDSSQTEAVETPDILRGTIPNDSVETPSETGGDTAGIAHRVSESRGVAAERGEGISASDSIEHGRELLKEGLDPETAVAEHANHGAISGDAMALVRAHAEELSKAANKAADEFGTDSPQYKAAFKAESDWIEKIKPMQTEWHKIGQAQQGETEIDTGTFHGLQRAYHDSTGKTFTPEQAVEAQKQVNEVKQATEAVEAAKKKLVATATEGEATTAPKAPRKVAKVITDAAAAARERIKARYAEGRALSGIDPEDLIDHATVGAEYLAKGIVKAADFADAMVKEFGERIRPHLDAIFQKAKEIHQGAEDEALKAKSDAREAALKKRIAVLNEKIKTGDLTAEDVKQARPSTEVIEKLEQQRDELNAELGRMREVDAKTKELKAAIAEKEAKIKAGDLSAKETAVSRPSLPEVEKLKQERDLLNQKIQELRHPPKAKVLMTATEKAAGVLDRQIAELERQIKSGEIFPEGKKPKTEDPALKNRRDRLEQLKYERQNLRDIVQAKDMYAPEEADPLATHKAGSKWTPEQSSALWSKAKDLIDQGRDFDDIRHQLAKETGLPVADVTEGLASKKGVRPITDEMYAKMAERRRVVNQAKQWVTNAKYPGWLNFAKSVPSFFFNLATFGHGTVGMITHAGNQMFNPGAIANYWKAFGQQFKLLGWHDKGAYHERIMQDLTRDPNFIKAKRAGLANDPFKYQDDYQNAGAVKFFKKIGLSGNRGFDALKLFRQERFNRRWDSLPPDLKTPEMAQVLADIGNHETGVVRSTVGKSSYNWVLFAPKLEASRWAFLIGDPAKATKTFLNWKGETPEARAGAVEEVKQKALIAGTYIGALAINQGFLSASGSDEEINFTDPRHGDWLSFKVAGHRVGIISPMIGSVRFLANVLHDSMGDRSKFEKMQGSRFEEATRDAGQYLRGKASPFTKVATDAAFQADFRENPMPWNDEKISKHQKEQGVHQFTYAEYAGKNLTPIPLQEAITEVWKKQGMNEDQITTALNALLIAAVSGGTGAKVSEDTPHKKK